MYNKQQLTNQQRVENVLDLARDSGIDLSKVKDQRGLIDAVTGKRMFQEQRLQIARYELI